MLEPQDRQPVLLPPANLELLGEVAADFAAKFVAAPAVAAREGADGDVVLGDLLPVLPLDLGGEDDLFGGDAGQQLDVGPGLALGGRERYEVGFLDALGDGVREVIALLGKLVDREGPGVLRLLYWVCQRAGSSVQRDMRFEQIPETINRASKARELGGSGMLL